MRLEQEEIFGPVLCVIQVRNFDEAVRVNNGVKYGLSSSLYTRDVNLAFRAMQELDNGITYVNAPTIGAEAHLPFGGVKQTGNGHREGGWEVYEFYSETKVGYVDYSRHAAAGADRQLRRLNPGCAGSGRPLRFLRSGLPTRGFRLCAHSRSVPRDAAPRPTRGRSTSTSARSAATR